MGHVPPPLLKLAPPPFFGPLNKIHPTYRSSPKDPHFPVHSYVSESVENNKLDTYLRFYFL